MRSVSASRPPSLPRLDARWRTWVDDFATAADLSQAGAAVASASGRITVFAADDGAVRWARDAHAGGVLALAWHPHLALLATAGQDGHARVWNDDGALRLDLADDAAWVEHLSWSPDGEYLAIASGRIVQIVRPSGATVARLGPHPSTVTGLAWNRAGERIATSHYGGVTIWTARTGKVVRKLAWKGSMISLAWSPDGRVVASGEQDASVHLWRLASGEDSRMGGYASKVKSLAWDSRSSMLATSGEPDVIVWEFRGRGPEGSEPIQLPGDDALVGAVAFAPRGLLLASGAANGSVRAWDLANAIAPLVGVGAHEGDISVISWTGGGREFLATDAVGGVALWRLP